MDVSIIVRGKNVLGLRQRMAQLVSGGASNPFLTREQFAEQFGADRADIAAVRHFAMKHNLSVINESLARRTVVVSGTIDVLCNAFCMQTVPLRGSGIVAGVDNTVRVPAELQGVVEAILGLNRRAIAAPRDV